MNDSYIHAVLPLPGRPGSRVVLPLPGRAAQRTLVRPQTQRWRWRQQGPSAGASCAHHDRAAAYLSCRLYDGYTLRCKYKGHTNRNTQVGGPPRLIGLLRLVLPFLTALDMQGR